MAGTVGGNAVGGIKGCCRVIIEGNVYSLGEMSCFRVAISCEIYF